MGPKRATQAFRQGLLSLLFLLLLFSTFEIQHPMSAPLPSSTEPQKPSMWTKESLGTSQVPPALFPPTDKKKSQELGSTLFSSCLAKFPHHFSCSPFPGSPQSLTYKITPTPALSSIFSRSKPSSPGRPTARHLFSNPPLPGSRGQGSKARQREGFFSKGGKSNQFGDLFAKAKKV